VRPIDEDDVEERKKRVHETLQDLREKKGDEDPTQNPNVVQRKSKHKFERAKDYRLGQVQRKKMFNGTKE